MTLVAMISLLAGCGGDDDSGTGVQAQSLPSSVQGIVILDGERPVAWARDLTHATAVAYELCPSAGCTEVTLIGLGGDAGDVAAVEGLLWVSPARSDEAVRVVDPTGDETVVGPTLPSPTRIAGAGAAVFVASGFDLHRFDAADPLAEPEVVTWSADTQSVGAMVATPEAVWVAGQAGELARVDAATLEVTARGQVDGSFEGVGAMAVGPDGLFLTTTLSGVDTVTRLDPDTLDVTASLDLPDDVTSAAVTVDGDRVLVATGRQLLALDPATLEQVDAWDAGGGVALDIAVVGGRVWIVSPLGVDVVDR